MHYILELIKDFASEELKRLGEKTHIMHKQKAKTEKLGQAKIFNPGDIVSFKTKDDLQTGVVLKISPSLAKINTLDGSCRIITKYLMPCEDPSQDILKLREKLFEDYAFFEMKT